MWFHTDNDSSSNIIIMLLIFGKEYALGQTGCCVRGGGEIDEDLNNLGLGPVARFSCQTTLADVAARPKWPVPSWLRWW